jgi:hypothetical protein
MKTFFWNLVALLLVAFVATLQSSENNFKIDLSEPDKIQWNIGFETNAGSIESRTNVNLVLNAGLKLTDHLIIGLKGDAMWYDYRLNELDPDMSYHLESGYVGFYIEPTFDLNDKFKLSFPILLGSGQAMFKYDGKYRDELTWTEEIIDKETFSVFEPSMHLAYFINNNMNIFASVNYRFTSPLRFLGADDNMLTQPTFGLGINYVFNK